MMISLRLLLVWENNLIVNVKKTKTECVLFGAHQRTCKAKSMEVKMNGVDVTESTFYECLGVAMDKILTLAGHLNKVIKKASSRTNLSNRIRRNTNPYTAKTIYKVTIHFGGYALLLLMLLSTYQIQENSISKTYKFVIKIVLWMFLNA